MKTTYLTTLTTRFNPFRLSHKTPRLFLTLLPPNAHKSIKISAKQLPRISTEPATLELGFKDGKTVKFSWSEEDDAAIDAATADAGKTKKTERVKLKDIVEEVDRHARLLGRKEELNG